ncbi:MAG: tetraacyldisaccharide 4'-kinase [Alphaproteobacteria bacterium]|nr:tetraacyldisaccharide 4'-kinase [Alphaproteobacteria bacterium]
MKTPRFWYPPPGDKISEFKAKLLSPLSRVFEAGTALRRRFAKAYRSPRPVICIGNAVAGGAGKTPVALALARLFSDIGHKPVFVSRGYGGRGKLTCVDLRRHDATDVGDEAMLLAATAPTWVGRDRVKAVREAETHGSVIIADDGLQNPNLAPSASILVVDGEAGIGNGRIIPAGPLREPFLDALSRATAMIVIGKDPYNLGRKTKIPVFQAHFEPVVPKGLPSVGRYVAFAGIGRPSKFFTTARLLELDIAAVREFPDHYIYTTDDVDSLRLDAEVLGARLITTEKDAVRLPPYFRAEVIVIPVRLVFDIQGSEEVLVDILLKNS